MMIANLRRRVTGLAGLTAIATATAGCGGDDAAAAPVAAERSPIPVIVDYSPTVSDVGALLYLATHPDVELLAVTLAGTGESRCAAAVPNTLGLLELAGASGVPVACGVDEPIGRAADWPAAWRDAADRLAPLDLRSSTEPDPRSAVDLLADSAEAGADVVIVALGPLTNIAGAMQERPEVVSHVSVVYTMGGAIGVPGNGPDAAEWNFAADPAAAEAVLGSDLPVVLVPLDATNQVPVNEGLYHRMEAAPGTPALDAVRQLWSVAKPWEGGMYLWDELTAMLAVDPELAPIGTARIEVTPTGQTVATANGMEVKVASRPNRRAVETTFLNSLSPSA